MLSFFQFSTALASILAVAGSPVEVAGGFSLPVKRHIARSNGGGTQALVQRDWTRVDYARGRAAPVNVPVTNALLSYVINVTVGEPPQQYQLLVDTGSSNTWVGNRTPYLQTSSSTQTNQAVHFNYSSGFFSGLEFTDRLDLGSGLVVEHQSIGVANASAAFDSVDGIMGLGPIDLTLGSLSPNTSTTIPTVTDNLFAQGIIPQHLIGVALEPSVSPSDTNGVITFGGIIPFKFDGDIHYTPRTKVQNSSLWWGIEQTTTYGNSTPITPQGSAGIVDTGSSLLLLDEASFARYQNATGAALDPTTGLLHLSSAQFANLESLFFDIDGVKFELTPNGQILPRAFYADLGLPTTGDVFLAVQSLGPEREVSPNDTTFNFAFVLGMIFHERFYVVYDTANDRVGFAPTPFTYAIIN